MFDDHGIVEGFNPAATRISGWSAGEMMGRKVAQLLPGFEGEDLANALAAGYARGEHSYETIGRRKDGSIFPVDIAISALTRGTRRGFIGSFRDLTARKAADRIRSGGA